MFGLQEQDQVEVHLQKCSAVVSELSGLEYNYEAHFSNKYLN